MVFSLHATEIVAHRGFSARAPENTVAAFKLAWEEGADACELDLHLTADGEIAILHDKDTKRTTGLANLVAKTTLAALQKLDAGSWKNATYKGEPIPTLKQALATLPEAPNKRFFLEVKCGPEVVPVMAKQLEAWKPRAAQLCIIAFDREVARESKAALPWMKVYRLSSGKNKKKQATDLTQLIADTKADALDGLDLGKDFPWTEAMVKQVRDAGLELYVWTLQKPGEVTKMVKLGVDGITVDDPVMAREAMK
jgi:glycerophosphoryl diester phosphodiesterase